MFEKTKWSRIRTVTAEELAGGIVLSVWSCAPTVNVPAAFSVIENVLVPFTSCAGEGSVALTSVASIRIAFEIVVTTFQVLSQAFTVTVNGLPATWARGVPDLPDAVPGAAVSPGSNT